MNDISTEQLRKEIVAILKTADLSVVSAKKVREQIEKKVNCSLASRKKEFDGIVMDFINQQHESNKTNNGDESSDGSENGDNGEANGDDSAESEENVSSDEKITKTSQKRPPPTKKKSAPKKKRKSVKTNDSGTESDGDSDSDYEMPKKPAAAASKKKKAASGTGGNTGRKSTGFTRSYNLSPELSAIMGAEALPRHEVVKKVWAIIKERNLYDPKNKQYAICDDELLKVMKVKRFRTFGMLKHLKPHFLD